MILRIRTISPLSAGKRPPAGEHRWPIGGAWERANGRLNRARATTVIPIWLHWDHNAHYHDYLLRRLPTRFTHALDVGCGTGAFALALAQRAVTVDAIDRTPAMIAAARAASGAAASVNWIEGDVLHGDFAGRVLATVANPLVGAWLSATGRRLPAPAGMPVRDPETSLEEIRAAAVRLTPGAEVRRHLFFRYSLVWRRET
jgi:SAM-dependent methyltransferase